MNISRYRMTARMAEKTIHEWAQNTSNIIWGGHCVERSEERDIGYADALKVLRTGHVLEPVYDLGCWAANRAFSEF